MFRHDTALIVCQLSSPNIGRWGLIRDWAAPLAAFDLEAYGALNGALPNGL